MIHKILLLIIHIIFAFNVISVKANSFGESCSVLPISDSDGYLSDNTAYGYIKKNIDMKTYVDDACNAHSSLFKFCIRSEVGANNIICNPVSMSVNDVIKLSSISSNSDITNNSSFANIELSANIIDDKLCLVMPTSRGPFPLMCREHSAAKSQTVSSDSTYAGLDEICKTIGKSCYDHRSKSQSLLNFSGLTIHCLRDTLKKVFYLGSECPPSDDEIVLMSIRPFAAFQGFMKNAIRAALILYVMVYGFKVVMNREYLELNKISLFIIKFIFVLYFAIGIGTKTIEQGQEVSHNGMTEFALPILVDITSSFAETVFLAAGSQGLCDFDSTKYDFGYDFYKLWDAIDCRIGYYLGMQILYNIGTILTNESSVEGNTSNSDEGKGYKVLKSIGVFSIFPVMAGFFLSGNIMIVLFGLIFVVIFMSLILHFFTLYLVCMITLYVMAYISPIFIPMILFERTKSYFDSWLRVVASCTLQPAVVAGFIALLLTMYDSAIYGNCEFKRHDYSVDEFKFSTFELKLPEAEQEVCKASFGYKLLQYYMGVEGWEEKIFLIFKLVNLHDKLNLLVSLAYVLMYLFIFYFFVQSVNEFASDITGGPNMGDVTGSPTFLMDKIGSSAAAMIKSPNKNKDSAEGGARSGDKVSTGSSRGGDSVSQGVGRGNDKMSGG